MDNSTRGRIRRLEVVGLTTALLVAFFSIVSASDASAATSRPHVLYVGALGGVTTPKASTFATIQAAVNAARPSDWILIAPGDYHEKGDSGSNAPTAADVSDGWYGGVDITTPRIHLRGMNRNSVIVDGTLAKASKPCSAAASDQNTLGGKGRNGILVWKANRVSVENLTVCNFLAGSGSSGNEIWWNGGSGSSKIGLSGYSGNYLTATSTYFKGSDKKHLNVCAQCALYGIFSSDSTGPAFLSNTYANNFSDSGMYVGACQRVCNVTIDHAWMENNALGYSGTNSGGRIIIKNSMFDNNKDGFDTNTALTGDPPPPQDGRCAGAAATSRCWVFTHNTVENNNNPNVPISGTAGLGPTGTGMTISGGRYDTVTNNVFVGNGAWGMAFIPYPDGNLKSDGRTCRGTGGIVALSLARSLKVSGLSCLYDPWGGMLTNNTFSGNGFFGNPGNADYANVLASGGRPVNCFSGNVQYDATLSHPVGPATSANAEDGHPEQTPATCGALTPPAGLLGSNTDTTVILQMECDAGLLSGSACSSAHYPQATAVVMHPLPVLASMPNPCVGVPANLWCPNGSPVVGIAASS
jgi:hypothetical protein